MNRKDIISWKLRLQTLGCDGCKYHCTCWFHWIQHPSLYFYKGRQIRGSPSVLLCSVSALSASQSRTRSFISASFCAIFHPGITGASLLAPLSTLGLQLSLASDAALLLKPAFFHICSTNCIKAHFQPPNVEFEFTWFRGKTLLQELKSSCREHYWDFLLKLLGRASPASYHNVLGWPLSTATHL